MARMGHAQGDRRAGVLSSVRQQRAKTHYGWSYQRNAYRSYTWTDPFGRKYYVATSR